MSSDDVVEVSPVPSRPRGQRRRGQWPAVAFVLVLALAVGGVVAWLATRDGPTRTIVGGSASAPVTCPVTSDAGAVPAKPTATGVDGRLVPDADPVSITLCEYDAVTVIAPGGADGDPGSTSSGTTTGLPLGRSGALTGTDPGAADLLRALRTASPQSTGGGSCFGNPAFTVPALVGLTYGDGEVWVASAGPCAGSTNGRFASDLQIEPLVGAALDAVPASTEPSAGGVEPAPPMGIPSFSGEPADPGNPSSVAPVDPDPFAACESPTTPDPDDLVPFTPVAVRVCHVEVDRSSGGTRTVDRPQVVANSLVTALADLPVLEPDIPCTAIGGEQWGLRFSSDDGRTAFVVVDAGGCGTASNGVRTLKADAALLAAVSAAD